MNKVEKQELKRLKEEKKYEYIFQKFGAKEFRKCVDKQFRKEDIKKLKKEGKYEDIYLRYGESVYNNLLHEIKQKEIEDEYGKKSPQAIINKVKYNIKASVGILLYSIGILGMQQSTAQIAGTVIQSELIKASNEKEYEELIKEYKSQVQNYADNIKKMGLADLEIFMKLQDDMHKSILGYGTPKLDIEGYFGVDIGQDNATGVCRNMADDIVNKLNAINPDYNARMFIVKAKKGEADEPGIQKKYAIGSGKSTMFDNTMIRNTEDTIYYLTKDNEIYDMLGNHAVVAVDLKNENITLIIDPTNIYLGVFKDGKITIFNSVDKENPYSMYRTPLHDVAYRGIESLEVPLEYIKSFLNPYVGIESLNEKYGFEAQEEALKSAKKKEQDYICKASQENNFKKGLKVKIEKTKEEIYPIDKIEDMYAICMKNINNAKKQEDVLNLSNICRVLDYSIKYYKQQKIIGQDFKDNMMLSTIRNLEISELRKKVAKQIVETNALILPTDANIREIVSIAYLQAGEKEKIQELKVVFEEDKGYYYILNDNMLLATVEIRYNETGNGFSMIYNEINTKTDNEVKELLGKATSILQTNKEKLNSDNENIIE